MVQEIDQSNKLDKFKKAVFAEIDTKRAEIEIETAALKETQLEINKDNQLNNMYNLIQETIKNIKKECRKEVSKFDLQAHRELLIKRTEITSRVIDSVKKRLLNFCITDKYYDYLKDSIENLLNNNIIQEPSVLLAEKDMRYADKIKAEVPKCNQICQSDDILIGGFIIKSEKSNVYFDETFDEKLEEQKQYFIQNSRLYIIGLK